MPISNLRLSALPVGLALCLSLFVPQAQAFSDDEARRAILELRGQVQQMREQSQQSRLQLADQIDHLNQELAQLRGQLEELRHFSASEATQGGGPQRAQGGTSKERDAYESAADHYRSGQYTEAATGFTAFLKDYPDSRMAGTALFYLGSSQYASKAFKESIQTMETLAKEHPDDPRAADALLVVAADQIEINQVSQAKSTLQRIVDQYPDSTAAETAKSRMKLL